jgi:hypothetical protein
MNSWGRGVIWIVVFGVATLADPLRASSCDTAPLYDLAGPNCSASRQGKQCGCSECMVWDPAPGATWYEIRRCERESGECTLVGNTRLKNRGVQAAHPQWCVAWDSPFPELDVQYDYMVRSCTDGPNGPLCSAGYSNSVGYVAAPYMCIDNGVEVPCQQSSTPVPDKPTDTDGDGVSDVVDLDDDGDGIDDRFDACPLTVNIGQRDSDGDGVGDACDSDPKLPGSPKSDMDHDGIPDVLDNCAWVRNSTQLDDDRDLIGNACDNCPTVHNQLQTDSDDDDEGDGCDRNDGVIYGGFMSRSQMSWVPEDDYTSWCVYRGDLAELKRSRIYTQAPGSSPLAARYCSLSSSALNDSYAPAPGSTAFYLVGGRPASWQLDLGSDSEGRLRTNTNPCP